MKVSEMSQRQKKAFYNIKWAAIDLIGGLENTLMDYPEDSEEYQRADAELRNHQALVEQVYELATTAIFGEGFACYDPRAVQAEIRDINFCGKEFLMERCEKRVTKEGY